jgi:hypothetical protein
MLLLVAELTEDMPGNIYEFQVIIFYWKIKEKLPESEEAPEDME